MKIVIVDGQGGGVGRMLVRGLRRRLPGALIVAVGTNAMATSAMLRAGASAGATGENAVCVNCGDCDILLGPSGIAVENAMLGEISPRMATAVRESAAEQFLLPMFCCGEDGQRPARETLDHAAEGLVEAAVRWIESR